MEIIFHFIEELFFTPLLAQVKQNPDIFCKILRKNFHKQKYEGLDMKLTYI